MFSRIKSFDVYRKLPKDLAEPSITGGIGTPYPLPNPNSSLVSLTCTLVMAILFFSELQKFLRAEPETKMFIDKNQGGEKVYLNTLRPIFDLIL